MWSEIKTGMIATNYPNNGRCNFWKKVPMALFRIYRSRIYTAMRLRRSRLALEAKKIG